MTKLKSRPKTCYHAFIVEPDAEFTPKNWQEKPETYRVIEYLGAKELLGRADAWRFLHNHQAIESRNFSRWAVWVG